MLPALALCLSGPWLAVAHGATHAHTASEHGSVGPTTPFAVPTVEDGDHAHEHDHATIEAASTTRDSVRIDQPVVAVFPAVLGQAQQDDIIANQHSLLALLPRPGPWHGPPGGPRAPPIL